MNNTPTTTNSGFRGTRNLPELLAPAGSMTSLQAALDAGADAVYLGLDRFNMRRMAAANFDLESLVEASARCRGRSVRLYLALNTILYEHELDAFERLVDEVRPLIDAAIVSDLAALDTCQRLAVPAHVSTQMSVSNSGAARRLKALGARRIVLARECTLEEVAALRRAVPVELEAFVHGAMCVAVSGRCLLSHDAYGLSGNRGECRQPCRRRYRIEELDGEGASFEVGEGHVLSPRDLCSLPFLDRLVAAGIDAFKIEGRGRNADYVHAVVGAYRQALNAIAAGRFDAACREALTERCRRVFNREFSTGLYFGRPAVGEFTSGQENQASREKAFAGRVRNYYAAAQVVDVEVQDTAVEAGDTLSIQGVKTGVVVLAAAELRREEAALPRVEQGWFTTKCPQRVRRGDRVYVLRERTAV